MKNSYFLTICCILTTFSSTYMQVQSDDSCNLDFEKTILSIFAPQEPPNIQIRTLRRNLIKLLESMLIKTEEIEGWKFYVYPKRNLEALARAGYLHTLNENDDENQTETKEKRSFSSLVKNGQLPVHHYNDDKRNTNSDLNEQIQMMLQQIYSNNDFSKRNVAALLKNDRYMEQQQKNKKNIDYDDENQQYETTMDDGKYQKRFLGSIAKTGWYDRNLKNKLQPDKRHIGSLARLGWLPTVRNIRRFSRSGRSFIDGTCRETSSNGKNEDYIITENSIPLDEKRRFLTTAIWKFPLRTFN